MLVALPDALDAPPADVEPEDPAPAADDSEDPAADGRDSDSVDDAEGRALAADFDGGDAEPPADVEPEGPAPAAADSDDPPADGRDYESYEDAVAEPGDNASAVLSLQEYIEDDRNAGWQNRRRANSER